MNKETFYNELRKRNSGVFGTRLSVTQVESMEAILDLTEGYPVEHIAYIMATAYHEAKMAPSRESLYYTTAARIAAVWHTRFSVASAAPYVRNSRKLANKVYNGRLGNNTTGDDGYTYRGGGLAHETGRANYRKASIVTGVDLIANPDAILEPRVAAHALVHGATVGHYRGYKLSDFHTAEGFDYYGARDIINADKNRKEGSVTIGSKVKSYALVFEAALKKSGYDSGFVTPVVEDVPVVAEPTFEEIIAEEPPTEEVDVKPFPSIFETLMKVFFSWK